MKKIAILPGDGIGSEVMREAVKVLGAVEKVFDVPMTLTHADVGGCAIDNHGKALPGQCLCQFKEVLLRPALAGPGGAATGMHQHQWFAGQCMPLQPVRYP